MYIIPKAIIHTDSPSSHQKMLHNNIMDEMTVEGW